VRVPVTPPGFFSLGAKPLSGGKIFLLPADASG
jgi:hypothetical protein